MISLAQQSRMILTTPTPLLGDLYDSRLSPTTPISSEVSSSKSDDGSQRTMTKIIVNVSTTTEALHGKTVTETTLISLTSSATITDQTFTVQIRF